MVCSNRKEKNNNKVKLTVTYNMGWQKRSYGKRYDSSCRGATASRRSRDVRARKAVRALKLQDRTRARINKRARKEKYKKPLK